jgi:glycosyltransferase involved in cell wall biosynthesis
MTFLVAQLGARMHYGVPRILEEAGALERLYTDFYIGNKHWLKQTLEAVPDSARPASMQRLLGRSGDRIPPHKVTSFDLFGWRYFDARRRATSSLELSRIFAATNQDFCNKIINSPPPEVERVWAFNGAALELFRWAKSRGAACVLEQCMAPLRTLRRLLAAELERWPDWQPELAVPAVSDPLAEREEAEWDLADQIIAGSRFVTDEMRRAGAIGSKGTVVPYGVDHARFAGAPTRAPRPAGRLRILYAGEVGLRKGAPYLLQALHELGPGKVEARLAGRLALNRSKLGRFSEVASFLGEVPRSVMPALYRWADVLVLPSLCEGSATVTYEALASGIPVVATRNAGSRVRHGINGLVVEPQNAAALRQALDALSEDRRLLSRLAEQAALSAPEVGIGGYRDRLLSALALRPCC